MDVFDLGAVIIFISAEEDSLGKVLSANEMFFLAFGYEAEEIAGKFIAEFMPKHVA
jgi:PAS domain-containing protein